MLKFVKHHLENIAGIEIYPLISFTLFFVFFTALIIYVIGQRKEHIKEMENLPLNDII